MPREKNIKKRNTRFDKKVSPSTRRYLERQAGDPFVAEAKKRGFRSRAVFKIKEIDERYNLLKPGMRVVDLGAAPGGWSQYAAQKVKALGMVVALDKLEMSPIAGVTILQGDFTTDETLAEVSALCPNGVDLVMSDLAPETSGQSQIDHIRSIGLAELAADFATRHLAPGGDFVCKIFIGGQEKDFTDSLRTHFTKVKYEKPKSSRADSREIFVLATGFKPQAEE